MAHRLVNEKDPAWPLVRGWIDAAEAPVAVYPAVDDRLACLEEVGVTTRSTMGAVIYETGGILAAGGLLRILGSGSGEARSICWWRSHLDGATSVLKDRYLVVAYDLYGGIYALNGGVFGQETAGNVYHLAADALTWDDLEVGYSDFLEWCFDGDHGSLYEPLTGRFPPADFAGVGFARALSFYPFLWSAEGVAGEPDVRPIAAAEVVRMRLEIAGFTATPDD